MQDYSSIERKERPLVHTKNPWPYKLNERKTGNHESCSLVTLIHVTFTHTHTYPTQKKQAS